MTVKLLTEHHLEFLSLKGVCIGSSESTLVKMHHCRKSHVTAQMFDIYTIIIQGLLRLEKYLNIQDYLEKSLKIKFALKSTRNILKGLEKFFNFPLTGGFNTIFGDLNHYKSVVPLFGAAYAAPNKGATIL